MSGWVTVGDAIVCGVGLNPVRRRILPCPVCERPRRHVESWGGVWYGPTLTCCGCGDSWTDGELHPRPFQRAWRKEAIIRALRMWQEAISPQEYRAAVQADLDEHDAFVEEQRRLEASA